VSYDYLVVAPGLQLSRCTTDGTEGINSDISDFKNVKGLSGALEDPFKSNISTIYTYENSEKTWQLIEKFKGEGGAIFTQPQGIVKCAGGMCLLSTLLIPLGPS
jgi:hypothetical protein